MKMRHRGNFRKRKGYWRRNWAQLMAEGPTVTQTNDLTVIREAIKEAEKPPEPALLAEAAAGSNSRPSVEWP